MFHSDLFSVPGELANFEWISYRSFHLVALNEKAVKRTVCSSNETPGSYRGGGVWLKPVVYNWLLSHFTLAGQYPAFSLFNKVSQPSLVDGSTNNFILYSRGVTYHVISMVPWRRPADIAKRSKGKRWEWNCLKGITTEFAILGNSNQFCSFVEYTKYNVAWPVTIRNFVEYSISSHANCTRQEGVILFSNTWKSLIPINQELHTRSHDFL